MRFSTENAGTWILMYVVDSKLRQSGFSLRGAKLLRTTCLLSGAIEFKALFT